MQLGAGERGILSSLIEIDTDDKTQKDRKKKECSEHAFLSHSPSTSESTTKVRHSLLHHSLLTLF